MTSTSVADHIASLCPELKIAADAAMAAGKIIADGFGKFQNVELKGVGDLVSQIDMQADVAITEILNASSGLPILSEESNPTLDGNPTDYWIVDPLDATSAFLTQAGPQYPSVLIARQGSGETVSAIVYFPLVGEWFYAVRGQGAWKDGQPLQASVKPSALIESWVEMNQYADNSLETELFADLRRRLRSGYGARMVTTNPPHSGVAVRIAESKNALAVAIHDNQVDHVKQAAWDIAAPRLVLEEAGGVFMNFAGQPLDLYHAEPFIVARSRELAMKIISLQADPDCDTV